MWYQYRIHHWYLIYLMYFTIIKIITFFYIMYFF
jgi:hypothetical protein